MIANRVAYGETLVELVNERSDVVVLDADACKSTITLKNAELIPQDRFVQCGIAEQNMAGIAAGLAMCGKTPFFATFAVFTCMRAVEQIRNSICYANVNVKVVGTHAGLETGGDGGTHQAIEDIGIMRTLPHMVVVVPATPNSTRKLTRAIAEYPGPCYMRMGKDPEPELYDETTEFPIGSSKTLREGKDLTIIACGNMVWRALEAAKTLEAEGINVRVIDMYSIKPIDREAIAKAVAETRGILTVEDHNTIGGLGGAVSEAVTELDHPVKVKKLGLQDVFGRSGNPDKLYEMYHLTPADIAAAVRSF